MSSDDHSPPRCGRCGHTVRDGETYEDQVWASNSNAYLGVAHTPICPADMPRVKLPCPPCLGQLLEGLIAAPHLCHEVTQLEIKEGQMIPTAPRRCPCPCRRRPKGSEARGLPAPAHKLATPSREE